MIHKRALLSVSDKTGLVKLARKLVKLGYELVSTGGTATELENAGILVTHVSDLTGFPEMLDGRVKTLHPVILAGMLAKFNDEIHQREMAETGIEFFELVVVNFYPFAKTVASGATAEKIIEKIDIGGPTLVRSAAKNHAYVGVLTHPRQYRDVVDELEATGTLSDTTRELLASDAFDEVADYDNEIAAWFKRNTLRLQA